MDEAKLKALLNHSQDKIVVVGESGTYRYANAATERILGYSPSELVGRNVFEEMHHEDRKRVRTAFEVLVDSDAVIADSAEYRHRTADGEWVWLESLMSNEIISEVGGYVVSSREVTDRKRAERRERETKLILEQLTTNTEDVLWMFSADWEELLFINDAYEDIWGAPKEELDSDPMKFLDGIHPEDRPRVREMMRDLSDGKARDIEYRVNPNKGYRRWVWVKGQPVTEDGEVTRIAGFTRDITDRKRRERQLRVMDNLLRHNLRNDMNVILGHAEMVRNESDTETEDSMAAILETGERLLATAEKEREIIDLLVGIDETERLDLVALVFDAVEEFSRHFPEASTSILAPESIEVTALPELRRALDELLENAAEHAETTPDIEIRLRPFENHVEVEIEDNAPPIPGNEFEPLFRDNDPNELYHSTGLGLWLIYWVIDLSDGAIEFHTPGDDGNVITISLPRPES